MKTLNKLFAILAVLFAYALGAQAQSPLTQTTLAAAVTGGALYNGISPNTLQNTITLATVTGLTAPALGTQPTSIIYIGREAMSVITINTTTKQVGVQRGFLNTAAAPHNSGDMVLFGPINSLGNNAFFLLDPPVGSACTATATPSTPWINVVTGAQWLCSSVTGTWVPGWQNPASADYSAPTAPVASAAGFVTPTGPLFHITGALAITGFNIPMGFNATSSGGGGFCIIPDGTFTTTNANNIAIASTAVVNKELCYTWDAVNLKFVPTY